MKQPLNCKGIILALVVGLSSCNDILDSFRQEHFTLKVEKPGNEQLMIVENKKQPSAIVFSVKGNLPQEARIEWAPDSLLRNPVTYTLHKGKIRQHFDQSDYYSKKVYVRYIPLGNNNSGNLSIRVKIQ